MTQRAAENRKEPQRTAEYGENADAPVRPTGPAPHSALNQSAIRIPQSAFLRPANLVFALLLGVALVPLWAFEYFPSTDGPNHLYSAQILRVYGQPAGEIYRRFYTINPRPTPNWLSHATLAALMRVAPPRTAEKLLLSLYIIMLPLAARVALRALRPGAAPLALLFFPFIYNWPLQMGFYNFCFSLAVMLLTLAWWLRHAGRPRLRHGPPLLALLLLLYACHLVTLAMTLLALGVMACWAGLCDWQRLGRLAPAARLAGARLGLLLGATLPLLMLIRLFMGRWGGEDSDVAAPFLPYFHPLKFRYLFNLETTLFTFRVNELILGGLLMSMLGVAFAAALWRRARARRFRPGDGLLLVGLVWLVAYLLAPPNIGKGTCLYHRLAIFPIFAMLLWLGSVTLPRPARLGLQTVGAGFGLIFMLFYAQRYAEAQGPLAEYLSVARAVPERAVILPVCLEPRGVLADGRPYAVRALPFVHVSGLLALERGGVDLSDYEGATRHFPTLFRPAVSPAPYMAGDGPNNRLDLAAYERATGVRVEAMLVWQDALHRLEAPENRALAQTLEHDWRLAAVSRPSGAMRVYLRR